jgi:pyrroline-5-carboxylate reductase
MTAAATGPQQDSVAAAGPRPGQPGDRIAMIGGGQMALALAEGFQRSGLVLASSITVFDPHPPARERLAARLPGIRFAASAAEAVAGADTVILAVKPQQAAAACHGLALPADAVLVSIVAGLSLASLTSLAGTRRVVRVMPNTPCLVGRGVSVACRTADVPTERFQRIVQLLRAVGSVHEADESLLDAVTGLSGSGPGFVAVLVEALADGGVRAGLPRPLAMALAIETLAGTAALLEQTGEHPAQVKDRVASPGGTTIAGLAVLEQRGVRGAVGDAVVAAAARAKELGQPTPGR